MGKFCAKCGRPFDGKFPFIGNLCLNCYLEEHPLIELPRIVKIEVCRNCFSYRTNGKWNYGAKSYEEALLRALSEKLMATVRTSLPNVKLKFQTPRIFSGEETIEVTGETVYEGVPVSLKSYLKVRISPTICPKCSHIIQGVHNAIVQVRSAKEKLGK